MTADKYERYSEYIRRNKSPEQKMTEASLNLEKCFASRSSLTVSLSRNGNSRVRAHFPDEDAYAGWMENMNYTGAVKLPGPDGDTYLAERHFPYHTGSPTYLWEFTPATGRLSFARVDTATGDIPIGLAIPADEEHQGYFLKLTEDLANAHQLDEFDRRFSRREFTFQLEELQ
jgi:hypothetical protein